MKGYVIRGLMKLPRPIIRMVAGGRIEVDGQSMDKQSQLMTALLRRVTPSPLEQQSAQALRTDMARILAGLPGAPVEHVQDTTMVTRTGELAVRIYRPQARTTGSPALLYLHGGGWVMGSIATHDYLCGSLARSTGCVVVSLEYRLAPENPYPAGLDDCSAAFLALTDGAREFGLDRDRIAVGGDSAGGNLAAALCIRHRDAGEALPCHQLLVYPVTNAAAETRSYELFADGFLLTRNAMRFFIEQYGPDASQRTQPGVSPALAGDLSGLPAAHVVTAGYDPLRDEGRAYAEALRAAGVPTTAEHYPSTFHGFFGMYGLDVSERAIDAAGAALRRAFGT